MEASIIGFEGYVGNETFVESIHYDLNELRIIVVTNTLIKIEVVFHQPIGFRCLDEGDMLEYWTNALITQNWILQIHDSGWLWQESKRNGFLSKDMDIKEFLIKGLNDCICVLNIEEPKINLL